MLVCLLTLLYTCLPMIPNCPVMTVNFNHPKLPTCHPLIFRRLYLDNFKFKIYFAWLGVSPVSIATPSLVGVTHSDIQVELDSACIKNKNKLELARFYTLRQSQVCKQLALGKNIYWKRDTAHTFLVGETIGIGTPHNIENASLNLPDSQYCLEYKTEEGVGTPLIISWWGE